MSIRSADRYIVYKITNSVNRKSYIGITSQSIGMRWGRHRRSAFNEKCTTKLARAMRKYGLENFSIVQIAEAYSRREVLTLEKALISAHGTWHLAHGYNMTVGGDNFGSQISADRRAQISEQVKRQWAHGSLRVPKEVRSARTLAAYQHDPTYAGRISAAKKGVSASKANRDALRKVRRKVWEDPAYRDRMLPIVAKNLPNRHGADRQNVLETFDGKE